jgi:hypothetical protein
MIPVRPEALQELIEFFPVIHKNRSGCLQLLTEFFGRKIINLFSSMYQLTYNRKSRVDMAVQIAIYK